jgi:hypothetical protein
VRDRWQQTIFGDMTQVFESSCRFPFFDYFRVPYEVVEHLASLEGLPPRHPLNSCGRLRRQSTITAQRTAHWVSLNESDYGLSPAEYRLGSIPIFGRVLPDSVSKEWLNNSDLTWSPVDEIRDHGGTRIASVWRTEAGDLFLPFDPGEIIENYWSEAYQQMHNSSSLTHLKRLAVAGYYRARPLLPRAAQISLRRAYSNVQRRARFPGWPIESALHDFYGYIFRRLVEVADGIIPWIGFWPSGYSWALVLTHDVETQVGYDNLNLARAHGPHCNEGLLTRDPLPST